MRKDIEIYLFKLINWLKNIYGVNRNLNYHLFNDLNNKDKYLLKWNEHIIIYLYTKVTIDWTNSRPTSNVYAEDTVEIIFAFLVGRYAGAC